MNLVKFAYEKIVVMSVLIMSMFQLTGCGSNENDIVGDYKITRIDSLDENHRDEEYFKVYENYGIFFATLSVNEDGSASINSAGSDESINMTYDENYFTVKDNDNKVKYKFENGVISLSEFGALASGKLTFKKMTSEEQEAFKKGFTEEDLKKAVKEASELDAKYIKETDNSFLSYVENSRRATDAQNYDEICMAAQIAAFDTNVQERLKAGHTYSIVMTPDGTQAYSDGNALDDSDPFCVQLNSFLSNYKAIKVRSSLGGEYIVDIDSDGTVKETSAPVTD